MLKPSRNALTHLAKRYRAVLRRCRLRALALACACALTALPPLPAGANSGGTETSISGTPAYIGSTTGSGGHVIIDSGFDGSVHGGYTTAPGTDATDNTVIISGGTVTMHVYGGTSQNGSAHNNTTIISGGTVNAYVYGGSAVDGSATNNTVIISGGRVEREVCGGSGKSAHNNTVIISGGRVERSVWGGYAQNGSANGNKVIISGNASVGAVIGGDGELDATHNTVILSGAPDLSASTIWGGNGSGDAVSGNLLEVRSSGLTAMNIKNFAEYAFVLPADIRPGAVLLTLGEDPYVPSVMYITDLTNFGKSPSPDIQRIDVDVAASPLRVGDKVTLFRNDNGLTAGTLPTSVSGTQGVTLAYTYALSNTNTTLDATVTDTRVNPQTKALSEGHVSGTALALQGADLAAGRGWRRPGGPRWLRAAGAWRPLARSPAAGRATTPVRIST